MDEVEGGKALQTNLLAVDRELSTDSSTMRRARLDICVHADSMNTIAINIETELNSDRTSTLRLIQSTVGSKEVSFTKLDFAPAWLVGEAFQKEHIDNWINACASVGEDEVPYNAKCCYYACGL